MFAGVRARQRKEMLSFRELQLLAEDRYTIQSTRKDLNRLVDYFTSQPEQQEYIEVAFVEERGLPIEIAKEQRIFFIQEGTSRIDIPEEFQAESLGMVHKGYVVYEGRLVYPVFDVKGDVMGFCGWDKFVQPKYLDSKNYGYKAKATTFYGMEKLEEYYKSSEPVYAVEGIVCCLYLRSIGLQSVALLGSGMTSYVATILKRFGRRLIVIPDNDAIGKTAVEIGSSLAGEHFVRQAKKLLPLATVVQSRIAKDIDDSRKVEGLEETLRRELVLVSKNPYLPFKTLRVRK